MDTSRRRRALGTSALGASADETSAAEAGMSAMTMGGAAANVLGKEGSSLDAEANWHAERIRAEGGGCPNARRAGATAACPRLRALAISTHGGLGSETADDAFGFEEGMGLLTSGSTWSAPDHAHAEDDEEEEGEGEGDAHDGEGEEESTLGWAMKDGAGALAPLLLLAGVLGLFVALFMRRPRANGGGRGGRMSAIGLLAAFEGRAEGHNWITSPRSRAGKVSTKSPCYSRNQGTPPGIMVNRDQPFVVQWTTGHPGGYGMSARSTQAQSCPRTPPLSGHDPSSNACRTSALAPAQPFVPHSPLR